MPALSLDQARQIMQASLAEGRRLGLKPLTVAVIDAGGHLTALERQDGSSPMRAELAMGKARGAVALGLGSRALFERAKREPFFIQSVNALAGGFLVPVPGGVLMRDETGAVVGGVGITGDISDNDEACAVAGIRAVGLQADTGG
jgi:uncharacterized protein GlcG (DUF336 family)